MTTKQKKLLYQIIISFIVFVISILIGNDFAVIGFVAAYIIVGYDVIIKASRNIIHGQVFDESFLMFIATLGAFLTYEYPEAVMVMLLYQIGELFQSYAVGKSRKSIQALVEIAPEYANLIKDGKEEKVDPEEVGINDIILVKAGEKVPLDATLIKGKTSLNLSALTGESRPVEVSAGDEILSGSINLTSPIYLKVNKEYEDSAVSKILDLVENASNKKSKSENFITKFAKYYTPTVTVMALMLAIIPPLFNGQWTDYISRACSFLVISCPCALVISVPLTFFSGIGVSSKNGILVKGSNYLEALSKVNTVAFDKTGTLTYGEFSLDKVYAQNKDEDRLLNYALIAEDKSNHPIALSLRKAVNKKVDTSDFEYQEIAGKGIIASKGNETIYAGNLQLMKENNIEVEEPYVSHTIVYVAVNDEYLGYLTYSDKVKPEAQTLINNLKNRNIKTVILSGDQKEYANDLAKEIGVDEVHAELLPENKVNELESLLNEKGKVAFVGDGINDAPSLMRADVGIAMGAIGSDAAIEVSDIVIVDDDISQVDKVIKIATKTMAIVWQNIILALGAKLIVLILGAFGIASMWMAVFADVGIAFIAILNAMRAMKV